MSTATARPSPTTGPSAARRWFGLLKFALPLLLGSVLMYAGYQGKWRAGLQWKLREIGRDRDQLQQQLEDEPARPSPEPQAQLLATLKARLAQLDTEYQPGDFSEDQQLQLRLARATLANAETRYADALSTLSERDEQNTTKDSTSQKDRFAAVLQVRADSLYYLRMWQEALECYQQLLRLRPNHLAFQARLPACLEALGRTNEAATAYAVLAQTHNRRGNTFLAGGKLEPARASFEQALQIQTHLLAQGAGGTLTNDLAATQEHLANTFLVEGKAQPALTHYQQSLELRRPLLDQGAPDLQGQLAFTHNNAGCALLAEGKLPAALEQFDQARALLAAVVEQKGQTDLAGELARTYNNRGVVQRGQGKLDEALADFDHAVAILEPLGAISAPKSVNAQDTPDPPAGPELRLTVFVGYAETGIELLRRIWVIGQGESTQWAVTLATCIKNRGYLSLVQGKLPAALGDLNRAVAIYTPLADQADLAVQLAKTLSSIAWLQATYPDPAFRNGQKAKDNALKACQLSNWKAAPPVEALAAACAETSDFQQAVTLQQLALQLALPRQKPELNARLELYKAGTPYRAPIKAHSPSPAPRPGP